MLNSFFLPQRILAQAAKEALQIRIGPNVIGHGAVTAGHWPQCGIIIGVLQKANVEYEVSLSG